MDVIETAAVIVVALAAASDIATRKIPNRLTLGASILAVGFHGWTGGLPGVGTSLLGWTVGVALFFPMFALGGMGAGDVKLIGALGAWLGPVLAVWIALFSSIAGGVLALAVVLWRGYTRQAFSNLWGLLLVWRISGPRPVPELTLQQGSGLRLAYAVPVLCGTLVALWVRS